MMKRFATALIGAWAFVGAGTAAAETVIGTWSGERSTATPEFEVRAPWIVDWRTTGDLSDVVAVEISLINARTGAHEGRVVHTKSAGNGVRLFDQSGTFYFRVDATLMGWRLKVVQLTEKEAEAYTPKSAHPLDQ